MKKTLALLLSSAILLTSFSACTSKEDTDATVSSVDISAAIESGDVVVGGILSLTGEGAVYGIAEKEGIELAVEQINANGGVLGKPLVIDIADDESSPEQAKKIYERLPDGTTAVIGSTLSSTSETLSELTAADGVPMFSPTASVTNLTSQNTNVFRLCCTSEFQAEILAQIAMDELKATSFAVLYNESNVYSKGLVESFETSVKAMGYDKEIEKVTYDSNEKSFKEQINTLSASNPDVLFIPEYQDQAITAISALKDTGINGVFLGGDSWDQIAENHPEQKELLEGSYYITGFSLESSPSSITQQFATDYSEKYEGKTPSAAAAHAYDSVYLLKQALESSGSSDKNQLLEQMSNITFDGVCGRLTFSGNGTPTKDAYVMKISDGKGTYYQDAYQVALSNQTNS